jgi:hypothetical protein
LKKKSSGDKDIFVGVSISKFAYVGSELGAPDDLYRYIPESSRSLKLMQKNKVMEMGSSRFFID